MDRRLLVVLLIGGVIAGVCAYRLQTNEPYDYAAQLRRATTYAPAPLFEGVDEDNQMFRLQAYLGRHRILVAFYDGEAGANRSRELHEIQAHAAELAQRDVKIVAVSRAIPQDNRRALDDLGDFPGPLISDVAGEIHERWGRMSPAGTTLPGLFLIDRKGTVASQGAVPRSYADFPSLWQDLK